MTTNRTRALSVILTVLLIISAFPFMSLAADLPQLAPVLVDPVNDPPVATEVEEGARLRTSTISGGAVKHPETGEILTDVEWGWTTSGTKVKTSGKYEAYCISASLGLPLVYEIYVRIIGDTSAVLDFSVKPTAEPGESFFSNMILVNMNLVGGVATLDGVEIAGHFEWRYPNNDISSWAGKQYSSAVKFVPDDETYAPNFADYYSEITFDVPSAMPIELADGITEIVKEYKTLGQSSTGARLGLTFKNGLDASTVTAEFEESFINKPVGTYENVNVKFSVRNNKAWLESTADLTVKIIPANNDSAFGTLNVQKSSWGADLVEGQHEITLAFSDDGKTGTATVKVNGEIVAEGIEPTYKHGENSRVKSIKFIAPESGSYTVTAEYIPGENDSYIYSNTVLTASFDAVVRTERKITVAGGKIADAKYYCGDRATVEFVGNTDDFARWEFTDSTGKVLTAAVLSNNELTVTDSDLTRTKITFIVPDYDIKITAKDKAIIDIPTTPGDGSFDFASIWNAIVEFFAGISENCPFISGIAELVEFVISFFTGLFK